MKNNLAFATIIIPCRNEEKYISQCFDSVIKQNYPKENLEVLVIDGMSEDKTREIVGKYTTQYPFIKLLENSKKFTPFGLNIGIKNAKGEVILRMDAHATYKRDYISKCMKYLKEYGADNVGGIMKTLPSENTLWARAIAISLSHPFGAHSFFRLGSKEPREVDTVFGGCYKKKVFEKIGFFNENLIRSQDLEFNLRLKKAGGKILLFPDIKAFYYPQSTLLSFLKHNFLDGIWAIYPLKFVKIPFRLRHYFPFLFVLSLLGTALLGVFFKIFFWIIILVIGFYFFVNLYFSTKIAIKERDVRYLFVLPIVFATRHFAYGLGSIFGFLKIFLK